MEYELETQRRGDAYRAQLARTQASERFWQANPIAYAVGPGGRVPTTTEDVLFQALVVGMPDEEWRKTTAALNAWRAYRAAHGKP